MCVFAGCDARGKGADEISYAFGMHASPSDPVAQYRGERRLSGNVCTAHAQKLRTCKDCTSGDLVNHIVARGACRRNQRDHTIGLTHRAGNDAVDIDEQQFDRADRRGACRHSDIG